MKTIQLNGVDYVSSKWLQERYKLNQTKVWRVLKDCDINYVTVCLARFYPMDQITSYINTNVKIKVKK